MLVTTICHEGSIRQPSPVLHRVSNLKVVEGSASCRMRCYSSHIHHPPSPTPSSGPNPQFIIGARPLAGVQQSRNYKVIPRDTGCILIDTCSMEVASALL